MEEQKDIDQILAEIPAMMIQRNFDKAQQSIISGATINPIHPGVLRAAASVLYEKEHYPEGIVTVLQAIAMDRNNYDGYMILTKILIAMGRHSEAIASLCCARMVAPHIEESIRVFHQIFSALNLPVDIQSSLLNAGVSRYIPSLMTLSPDIAPLSFITAVGSVELEISSYCNRKCHYCPNDGQVDRHSEQVLMEDTVFDRILDDLASINYCGAISTNRYNEPMAHQEHFLRSVTKMKKRLPNCGIQIFSNGDYCNRAILDELNNLGVSSILFTRHLTKTGLNESERLDFWRKDALNFLRSLNMSPLQANISQIGGATYQARYKSIDIIVKHFGLHELSSRGGSVESLKQEYNRVSPCSRPFNCYSIGLNGVISPCCAILTDFPDHASALLDKIRPQKFGHIFEIYAGNRYVDLRRKLLRFGDKPHPCNQCYDIVWPTNQPQIDHFNTIGRVAEACTNT